MILSINVLLTLLCSQTIPSAFLSYFFGKVTLIPLMSRYGRLIIAVLPRKGERMLGAIIGDLVGSPYDADNIKTKDFPLYNAKSAMTDDSYLTFEVAEVLLRHAPLRIDEDRLELIKEDLIDAFHDLFRRRQNIAWGYLFKLWGLKERHYKKPYNSYGNGGGMRVSPVGWAAKTIEEVKLLSKAITEITHNNQEGLRGAEAVAMAVFFAKTGKTKQEIEDYIVSHYYPRLADLNYKDLVKYYRFDVTAEGSIPEAIYCFLISESFSDALRTAVSIGGDTDTITCITAAISEAYYPEETYRALIKNFKYLFFNERQEKLSDDFYATFGAGKKTAPDINLKKIKQLELLELASSLKEDYPALIAALNEDPF